MFQLQDLILDLPVLGISTDGQTKGSKLQRGYLELDQSTISA
jgi:hypothetical protein